MNDQSPIQTGVAVPAANNSIAIALATAQLNMGKALKSANNPHFRSKYADLASVTDACMPALNEAGIAVIQPTTDDESGRYVETILIHGESGESLKCRVPLLVSKQDMQGYGSAVTYARRYGLMSMAGIAPEDDDGNAAAKAPLVTNDTKRSDSNPADAFSQGMLRDINGADNIDALKRIEAHPKYADDLAKLRGMDAGLAKSVSDRMSSRIKSLTQPSDSVSEDEIPY